MFMDTRNAEIFLNGGYLHDGSFLKTFIFDSVNVLYGTKTKVCVKFHFVNIAGFEGLRVSVLSGFTHDIADPLSIQAGTSKSGLFRFDSGVLYEEVINDITSSDMFHAFDVIAYDLGIEGHTPIYYNLGHYDLHLFQTENLYNHVESSLFTLIESLAYIGEDVNSEATGEVLNQIEMYLDEYSAVVKEYRGMLTSNLQNQMNSLRKGSLVHRINLHGEDGKALNERLMPVLHMMAGMLAGSIPAEILFNKVAGTGVPKQLQSVIEAPQVGLRVLPVVSQENGSMAFVGLIDEAHPDAVQFPQWRVALPGAKAVIVYSSGNLQVRVVRVFYGQAGVKQELHRLRNYNAQGVLFDSEQLAVLERVLSEV